ncbi:gliding motility-associated ABC transporter substrate-binding protein GldG [Ilyomonas limi]|uniref:Gliding motility-associated ABC transporter substrate-binding protein GldG n=1 Tax=Ilyomonas limi TaxID=2575867 RepID=A0A4U3L4V0_9BACT|nr:gliding motility-associated ABC transporter substrate-binding protein GldG [Ilyomonas limi]TKK70145.1 gliding motility-associated ABC transporter substrate-binding protein GldG [Ilyomonas limi]
MNKVLQHKYWWVVMVAFFAAIVYLSSFIYYRIDLTAEKRFTLSPSTKKMLENVDSTINIKVFLNGDLPADYKKLSIGVQDLLREFKDINNNIQVSFETPGEGLPDSAKMQLYDSLARTGVVFERNEDISATVNKATNQLIIPSALVYYKNKPPFAIDLRSSRTVFKNFNVINDEPQPDKEATRNAAEALLEFKFANAIDKLTRTYVPSVAYCVGNGEPTDLTVNDLGESLRNEYRLAVFDLKRGYPNPDEINALLIVKPTQPFSDEDKLKIDQYVMHGGKVLWFVDKLYAELDSLMRSQADFVAFDRNLNIDDILFKYGVRINGDLVQDLNCSKIPIVRGYNPDGTPQFVRIPWSYYPFLYSNNNNLISKNLDKVLSIFPSSIDTVKAPDIKKTILLATDTNSRIIASPALVSLNRAIEEISSNNFATYNKSHIPVAVLLEGKFKSLFANRLDAAVQDSVQRNTGKPFATSATSATKQIVVSDADIVTNAVSNTTGPLPMGELPLENYRFANREFFLNSVDYMVSNSGIFESRNKDFTLRLLDKKKIQEQRTQWQFINIVVPVVLIIVFGMLFQYFRKNKYAA